MVDTAGAGDPLPPLIDDPQQGPTTPLADGVPAHTRPSSSSPRRIPFGMKIAASIREQISAGELHAGDELPGEADLAERFQVSQRVVRDALRTLNSEGLIITRQGKRAVVREFEPVAVGNYMRFLLDSHPSAVEELLDLRALLEGRAARLSAERATPPEVAAMRRAIQAIAAAEDDVDARVAGDLELHDVVARASRNRFIHGMVAAMADVLAEERRRGAELTQSSGLGHAENDAAHTQLVDAIANGQPEEAERIAVEIVTRARGLFMTSRPTANGHFRPRS